MRFYRASPLQTVRVWVGLRCNFLCLRRGYLSQEKGSEIFSKSVGLLFGWAAFVDGQAPAECDGPCAQGECDKRTGREGGHWIVGELCCGKRGDGPCEGCGDVKFPLFQREGQFVGHHVAQKAAHCACDRAHNGNNDRGVAQ